MNKMANRISTTLSMNIVKAKSKLRKAIVACHMQHKTRKQIENIW